jgi:hypothetical protein
MEGFKLAERNKRRRQNYAVAKSKDERAKVRKLTVEKEILDAEKDRQRKQISRDRFSENNTTTR